MNKCKKIDLADLGSAIESIIKIKTLEQDESDAIIEQMIWRYIEQ